MDNKVFIIAELSANHNGSIEIAKETIKAIKRSGADAVKLQTYTADTLTINCDKDDFLIKGGTLWDSKTLYDLYTEAYTPWEWHFELFELAKELDLVCFSSPFDKTAVDFLESLNNPIYKIASFEVADVNLISYAAKKGKPMMISTGMADYDDIKLAIETCVLAGNKDITLLKCTSAYPASISAANLSMIKKLSEDFSVKVGLSDHTMGITVPVISVAMGATVIEKHFILDKSIGGPDADFSLDELEFATMVKAVREAESAIGNVDYSLSGKKGANRQFARSLYIVEDVKPGDKFTEKNIRSIRPGYGLHPKYYHEVLGKISNQNIERGTALSFDHFDK